MRFRVAVLVVSGLLLVPAITMARLPRPLPADYHGTYRVDRWGQHHFGGCFVSPELAARLKPYKGLPAGLRVTERGRLYASRSTEFIAEFDRAWKLPRPYEVVISYLQPLRPVPKHQQQQIQRWIKDLDSRSYKTRERAAARLRQTGLRALPALRQTDLSLEVVLRAKQIIDAISRRPSKSASQAPPLRIMADDTIFLKVTVINRAGRDLRAARAQFFLAGLTRYPVRSDGAAANFLPRSAAKKMAQLKQMAAKLASDKAENTEWLKAYAQMALLHAQSQSLYVRGRRLQLRPENHSDDWKRGTLISESLAGTIPALANGSSHVWTFALPNKWDAEAELIGHLYYGKSGQDHWVTSNALWLDVVGRKRLHKQPLNIKVSPPAKGIVKKGQPIPLRVEITNVSGKPIHFSLPFKNRKLNVAKSLFGYNDEGQLLTIPDPGRCNEFQVVRLQPGAKHVLNVYAPPGTVWARFVWHGGGPVHGGVFLDNNGGPQVNFDYPHGSMSPLTRIAK